MKDDITLEKLVKLKKDIAEEREQLERLSQIFF